ncbi:MAG TPA: hypothetical protein VIK61_03035 [Acidimicrobiia bacterium]
MNPHADQHDRPSRSGEIGSGPVRTDAISRTVEAIVFAPIGAAAFVREMGPDFLRTVVARGRAEVDVAQEQISSQLRHARGAGQVAIAFGLPLLRKKVEARLASLRPDQQPEPARPEPARPSRPAPATQIISVVTDDTIGEDTPRASAAGTNGHHAPEASPAFEPTGGLVDNLAEPRLAIPGYDALSASQVVERLAGLSPDELAAVRHYEAGHRRRRTILGKIEQLSA